MAERAQNLKFFERCFSGQETLDEVIAYLRGQLLEGATEEDYPQTFVERLKWKAPYPLIRHHFGRPTIEETEEGIQKIAEAMVIDVISLGIDQDAQENLFHPERQDPRRKGAGGVPVRGAEDYRRLYQVSRRGNFPLMRVYSGTDDHLKLAQLYVETINNAWCATSLFWFDQLDRRGPLGLKESIKVHQEPLRWHAERGIPVEVNEPHHWGMRDAPDVIYVVASFLSAYNAKRMGVKDYIAQYMFNSPAGLSDRMDLAKIRHRGPDEVGLQRGERGVLAQTRLSIIDVAYGHQPMSNEDGSLWIAYNGEIYNFRELRSNLRGHRLRTRSDTEVALHLYEDEGPDCLQRFDGMFALAILDGPELFLARDPLGVKPLYTAERDGWLYFASEMKALLPLKAPVEDFPPATGFTAVGACTPTLSWSAGSRRGSLPLTRSTPYERP